MWDIVWILNFVTHLAVDYLDCCGTLNRIALNKSLLMLPHYLHEILVKDTMFLLQISSCARCNCKGIYCYTVKTHIIGNEWNVLHFSCETSGSHRTFMLTWFPQVNTVNVNDHEPSSLHLHPVITQPRLEGGREPAPHHHAKCLQIVLVLFWWGLPGGSGRFRTGPSLLRLLISAWRAALAVLHMALH